MKYGYILVCADELPCIAVCEYGFGITHHESRVDSQEGELTLFLFDCESVFTLHIRANVTHWVMTDHLVMTET